MDEEPRCGRWRLKPFELLRPVLLRAEGPLTLGGFLSRPEPEAVDQFPALRREEKQALVLDRLRGAPPDGRLALFGKAGYIFTDVAREVRLGTPLGVRVIEAECQLVGGRVGGFSNLGDDE